ncbi:hypothetical protein Tco_1549787, partial [Tanacetum coccineum]
DPKLTNIDQTEHEEEKYDDEFYEEEEENIDDEVTKELYDDVNVNLGNVDTDMTIADQEERSSGCGCSTANKLREEAQAENQEFLNQVDSNMKTIIKDQVKAQVSKIMPKIEKRFYIDKMEANKSINRSDNQKNLYNALVESYNSEKDIITSYGDVVLLKRGRDDQDMPSPSKIQEEPSHTVEDSSMQQDQEFVTGNDDEQPADKEVNKADWFKKPERPPTPDPDWSKRQQVEFRPP